MTEREAKGLAAELDAHKWWRVQYVVQARYAGCYEDWWVRLRHRQTDCPVTIVRCEDSRQLARLGRYLMAYGDAEARHGGVGTLVFDGTHMHPPQR